MIHRLFGRLLSARDRLGHRRALLWIGIVAVVLALPSISPRFVFDDNTHALLARSDPSVAGLGRGALNLFAFVPGDAAVNRRLIAEGNVLPWWAAPDLKLTFWRPLSSLTHVLDAALWPSSARAMHLHSLAWYAALLAAVAWLFRRWCRPAWLAGLAFLLYAVDDAHAATVSWIANRNAIAASIFAVLAVGGHLAWRERRSRVAALGAVAALGVGLAFAEIAVSALAYLLAYAVCLERAPLARRVAAVTPYVVVVALWRLAYRWLGYGVHGSDAYLDPIRDAGPFLLALPKRFLVQLLGQLGAPPADAAFWKPPHEHWILLVLAVVTLALVTWLAWQLLKTDRWARFWALGAVLAVFPVTASFASDRTLLLVGVGASALLANVIGRGIEAGSRGELGGARALFILGYTTLHVPVAAALSPARAASIDLAASAIEGADRGIPRGAAIGAASRGDTGRAHGLPRELPADDAGTSPRARAEEHLLAGVLVLGGDRPAHRRANPPGAPEPRIPLHGNRAILAQHAQALVDRGAGRAAPRDSGRGRLDRWTTVGRRFRLQPAARRRVASLPRMARRPARSVVAPPASARRQRSPSSTLPTSCSQSWFAEPPPVRGQRALAGVT